LLNYATSVGSVTRSLIGAARKGYFTHRWRYLYPRNENFYTEINEDSPCVTFLPFPPPFFAITVFVKLTRFERLFTSWCVLVSETNNVYKI
jgi:hypothetical protein